MRIAFVLFLGAPSLLATVNNAWGGEPEIRRTLAGRLPGIQKIDEIRKTPVQGIYEIRIGKEILYSNENADYLFRGSLLSTADKRDLTIERIDQLSRIEFGSVPLADGIVHTEGAGERKMAVFVDPNCSFCKRLEREIAKVKNVTVYTVMIPILSADSLKKSNEIWCSSDRRVAWHEWMLSGKHPLPARNGCKAPTNTSLAFAQANNIHSTPTLIFEDGRRVAGAISSDQIEIALKAAMVKR